tara:strand:- start:1623 stop:2021 length:399 start_codon:yes stop_codon:yes gene_type:complete
MAKKFAKINSLNEVVKIYVVDDNETQSSVEALFGDTDTHTYKETSGSLRERPASVGGTYDSTNDAFINKKPYSSWTLNSSREWEAPVTEPTDSERGTKVTFWDDSSSAWKGMEIIDGVETITTWNPSDSTWS